MSTDPTGPERSRRRRAHQRGDHRLCREEHCPDAAPELSRGDELRRDLSEGRTLTADQWVLLDEMGRVADRLDDLDRALRGDSWMRLQLRDAGDTVTEVIVDRALGEARQQQAVYRQLMTEWRASLATAAAEDARPPRPGQPNAAASTRTAGTGEEVSGVTSLAARAAARRPAPPA